MQIIILRNVRFKTQLCYLKKKLLKFIFVLTVIQLRETKQLKFIKTDICGAVSYTHLPKFLRFFQTFDSLHFCLCSLLVGGTGSKNNRALKGKLSLIHIQMCIRDRGIEYGDNGMIVCFEGLKRVCKESIIVRGLQGVDSFP